MRRFKLVILIFILFAVEANAQPIVYKAIEPGLDCTRLKRTEGPQSIHVVRVQREHPGWQWTTGLGDGRVYGLASTVTIAKASAASLNAKPLAAINGDFFVIGKGNYQGDPLGLQIVEGEIVSAPTTRGCVWFDKDGQPHMGKVESKFRAVWPDKSETPFGMNEAREDGTTVLYTPTMAYNAKDPVKYDFSTRTTDGRELILEPVDNQAWRPFHTGKSYTAKVAAVREGGNSPITKTSVILSISPRLMPKVPVMKVGDTFAITFESNPDLTGARNAIGGGERLLAEGKTVADVKNTVRHPRSVIGWNKEHIFLIVVEGRSPKTAIGMNYVELAKLATELTCTDALNLDGGGSSTLWADGKVLNTPSDGSVRNVANALMLVELKK
ncbi:hypothetical protein BH11PLA2_BH11PLA2_10270 [soil metagenome]